MKRMRTSAGEISSNSATLSDDRVYYQTGTTCQLTLDDGPHGRPAVFSETRLKKLVPNPDDYTVACTGLSLATRTLPMFQPQVVLGQSNPNLLNYQAGFEFVWTGATSQLVNPSYPYGIGDYSFTSIPYNITPAGVITPVTFPVSFNAGPVTLNAIATLPAPAAADYGNPSSGLLEITCVQFSSLGYSMNAIYTNALPYSIGNVVTTSGSLVPTTGQFKSYICVQNSAGANVPFVPVYGVTPYTYWMPIIPTVGILPVSTMTQQYSQGAIVLYSGSLYVYTNGSAATMTSATATTPPMYPTPGASNQYWLLCTQPYNTPAATTLAGIPFWMFVFPAAGGNPYTTIYINNGILGPPSASGGYASTNTMSVDFSVPVSDANAALGASTQNVIKAAKFLGFMPNQVLNIQNLVGGAYGIVTSPRSPPPLFTRTFELYTYRNLIWTPEDATAAVPNAPLTVQDFGPSNASTYYNCYDYDWFLTNSVNPAFQTCLTDPNDTVAYPVTVTAVNTTLVGLTLQMTNHDVPALTVPYNVVVQGFPISLPLATAAYTVASNVLTLILGVTAPTFACIQVGQIAMVINSLTSPSIDNIPFKITSVNTGTYRITGVISGVADTSSTNFASGSLNCGGGLYSVTASSGGQLTAVQSSAQALTSYGGYMYSPSTQGLSVNLLASPNGFPVQEMCLQQQLSLMDNGAGAASTITWVSGMSVPIGAAVLYKGYAFVASVSILNSLVAPALDSRYINCGRSVFTSWSSTLLSGASTSYVWGQNATYQGLSYFLNGTSPTGSSPPVDSNWTQYNESGNGGITQADQACIVTKPPVFTYSPSTNLFSFFGDTYGFGGSTSLNLPGLYGSSSYNYGDDTYNDCSRESYGVNGMFVSSQDPTSVRAPGRSGFDENFHLETDTWFSALFSNFSRISLLYTDPRTLITTSYDHWVPQVTPDMQFVTYENPVLQYGFANSPGGALLGASATNGIMPSATVAIPQGANTNNAVAFRLTYGVINQWKFTQSYESSSSMWCPIGAIVMVSKQVPAIDEFTSAPAVLGQAGLVLGSTAGDTRRILLDFTLPQSSAAAYRSLVHYTPLAEYRRVALSSSGSDFNVFDFQLFWRNRTTQQLVPIVISNNGSLLAKFIFERK